MDASPRQTVYYLLILITLAIVCARILSAQLVFEPVLNRDEGDTSTFKPRTWPAKRPDPVPTFGSNDRSRWATAIALVDHGTYVIGRRDANLESVSNKYGNEGIIFDSDGWKTIDVVLNPETQEFYSSKPPLLATLVAGEYWLLKHTFGWSLKNAPGSDVPDDRWKVVPVILLTLNALPLLIYLLLLARIVEEYGTTDWGRIFVVAAACFGTMLTPFAITLNNHSIATCCVMFALYPIMKGRGMEEGEKGRRGEGEKNGVVSLSPLLPFSHSCPRPTSLITAGFFAGLTACLELPALSFALLLFVVLVVRYWRQTLLFFVPPALIPVAAFLLTNCLAVGQLAPVYEKFGTEWYEYRGSVWNVKEREAEAEKARNEGEPVWQFRNIDWAWHPQGAHESKLTYAFHLLVGHHGLFSLMPIFILSVVGMVWGANATLLRSVAKRGPLATMSACGLLLALVVIGFYIYKSHNYGGWTNGPRWLMWLSPLLLLAMLPVADGLADRRWGRWLAYLCLAVSVFSMNYWLWNPWRHPWIYNLMESQGWIQY